MIQRRSFLDEVNGKFKQITSLIGFNSSVNLSDQCMYGGWAPMDMRFLECFSPGLVLHS